MQIQGHTSVDGFAEATADSGAVHYSLEGLPSEFTLEAAHLSTQLDWKNGTTASSPTGEGQYGVRTDRGQHVDRFQDVTVELSSEGGQPEILVHPGPGDLSLRTTAAGGQSLADWGDSHVTRVGASPSAEGTNDSGRIGFWYEPEPSWITGSRLDAATVSGDFSLFLNNVTVAVRQGSETVWQNWTGYREERTGPTASYERHLLQVQVTNGTLTLAHDDAISVFGPGLDVQADGLVSAEAATGRLDLEEASFAFDDQPLRMEGEGSFHVRESQADPVGGLLLSVDESSRFDVHGGQRVDTGLAGSGDIAGWRLWAPVSLLGLAVTGVLAHRAGYASQALEGWRSRRYTKWMTRGRELANGGDYSAAAPCFRRATRAQPVKGVAWYHLAIALLEDQRPREVLEVIDEARACEAVIDELDFLDLEAQAARRVGDLERCRTAVAQLADGSPAMARTLVGELGLSEEVLGHELATRLSWEDDEGDGEGLPGYV